MHAIRTAAFATASLLMTFAQAQAAGVALPPRRPAAANAQQSIRPPALPNAPVNGPLAQPPGTLTPSGSIHLEMPRQGAHPLAFPSPAPTKTPEFNPLILRHEA